MSAAFHRCKHSVAENYTAIQKDALLQKGEEEEEQRE